MKKTDAIARINEILAAFQTKALAILTAKRPVPALDAVTDGGGSHRGPAELDAEYFGLVVPAYHQKFSDAFDARVRTINDQRSCLKELEDDSIRRNFFEWVYFQPLLDLLQFCRRHSPQAQVRSLQRRPDGPVFRLLGFETAFNSILLIQHYLKVFVMQPGASRPPPRSKGELGSYGFASAVELVALDVEWLHEDIVAQLCLPMFARVQTGRATDDERNWFPVIFNPYPAGEKVDLKVEVDRPRPRGHPSRDPMAASMFWHYRAAAILAQAAGRRTWIGPSEQTAFIRAAKKKALMFGVNIGGDHDFKKTYEYDKKGTKAWEAYERSCTEFVATRLAALFDDVLFPRPPT